MEHMELHSHKHSVTQINIKTIGNFEITLYPFNQKNLQYQVSSHNTVDLFSDNLSECFKYLSDNIDQV